MKQAWEDMELEGLARVRQDFPRCFQIRDWHPELFLRGVSGKPEQKSQKALIACLMAIFPEKLGEYVDEDGAHYPGLIVSVADFFDKSARTYTRKDGTQGRYSTQMQNYKRMGYQRGSADITVLYPCHDYHGFVCELKKPGNSQKRKEQKRMIEYLEGIGYYACMPKGYAGALHHWLTYLFTDRCERHDTQNC